jgi:hypothetical protein
MAERGALTEPRKRCRKKTVNAHSVARWGKRCARRWRVAGDGICRRTLCRESDGLADGNRREQVVGGVGCVQAVCGCKEEHTCNEIGDVRAQVCAPPGPAPISRDLLRATSSIDMAPPRVTCTWRIRPRYLDWSDLWYMISVEYSSLPALLDWTEDILRNLSAMSTESGRLYGLDRLRSCMDRVMGLVDTTSMH